MSYIHGSIKMKIQTAVPLLTTSNKLFGDTGQVKECCGVSIPKKYG